MRYSELRERLIDVDGLQYPIMEQGCPVLEDGDNAVPLWLSGDKSARPLVVLLHGFPDNHHSFDAQMPTLAEAGFHVVCPLLPGYSPLNQRPKIKGVAGTHDANYAALQLVKLVRQIQGEINDSRPYFLIGHDWGAAVGYIMAQHDAANIRSLMTLSVPHGVTFLRIVFRWPKYLLNAWYISFFQLKCVADRVLERHDFALLERLVDSWSPDLRLAENRKKRDAILVSVKATFSEPGVVAAALSYYRNTVFALTTGGFAFRRAAKKPVPVKTLAIRSSHDACMPEEIWSVMSAKQFPAGLTLELIDNTGHFIQHEKPEWLAERILKWLSDEL